MSDLIERPKQELIEFLRAEATQYPYVRGLYDAIDTLEAMRDALQEARAQIEHLRDRAPGTSNAVLVRIKHALARLEAK